MKILAGVGIRGHGAAGELYLKSGRDLLQYGCELSPIVRRVYDSPGMNFSLHSRRLAP